MEKIKDFMLNHFDFKFYGVTWIALLVGFLIIPCLMFVPQSYGYENGLFESIQLALLFATIALCIGAKFNRRFLLFCILALLIVIFREVNLGRTLFFHIPDTDNSFYSWKDIFFNGYFQVPNGDIYNFVLPMSKVAHGVYGLYITFVAILFWCKGIFKELWYLISKTKLPMWNLLLMGFASFCGAIAEKATNNNYIFEETFELLFYTALAGIVYLYSRHKNFALEQNEL